jgi:zinc transporter ZupT
MTFLAIQLGLLALVAVVAAGIGTRILAPIGNRIDLLAYAATGSLLGVALFDILPDAKGMMTWGQFGCALLAGFAAVWLAERCSNFSCPGCSHGRLCVISLPLVFTALSVHCLLDGVAFASMAGKPDWHLSGLMFGVAVHKLPEGFALGSFLLGSSFSRRNTILAAAAVESLTIVGGLAGRMILGSSGGAVVGSVMTLVAGGFLFLAAGSFVRAWTIRRESVQGLVVQGIGFAGTGVFIWVISRLVAV